MSSKRPLTFAGVGTLFAAAYMVRLAELMPDASQADAVVEEATELANKCLNGGVELAQ